MRYGAFLTAIAVLFFVACKSTTPPPTTTGNQPPPVKYEQGPQVPSVGPRMFTPGVPVSPIQHNPFTITTNDPAVTVPVQQPVSITTTNQVAFAANGLAAWTNLINGQINPASVAYFRSLTIDPTGVADSSAALQAALNSVSFGGEVFLPPGTYRVTTNLVVQDKTNFIFKGKGKLLLSGSLGGGASLGIQLAGTLHGITIDGIEIQGDGNVTNAHAGVFSYSGATLDGITVQNCRIHDVAIGVSINANLGGIATNCTVRGNTIWNIVGTGSGQGYGIHFADGNAINNRVVIENNYIEGAQRHSIYFARGKGGRISGNVIYKHRYGLGTATGIEAIAVARSSDVIVTGNHLMNYEDGAILAWTDGTSGGANIQIIGNFIGQPGNNYPPLSIGSQSPSTEGSVTNVLVEGNMFSVSGTNSVDCVRVYSGRDVTIRANQFYYSLQSNAPPVVYVEARDEGAGTATYSDEILLDRNSFFNLGTNAITGVYLTSGFLNSKVRFTSQLNHYGTNVTPFAYGGAINNGLLTPDQWLRVKGTSPKVTVQDSQTGFALAESWLETGYSDANGDLSGWFRSGYYHGDWVITNNIALPSGAEALRVSPYGDVYPSESLHLAGSKFVYFSTNTLGLLGAYLVFDNQTASSGIGAVNTNGIYGVIVANADGSVRVVSSLPSSPVYLAPGGVPELYAGTNFLGYGQAGASFNFLVDTNGNATTQGTESSAFVNPRNMLASTLALTDGTTNLVSLANDAGAFLVNSGLVPSYSHAPVLQGTLTVSNNANYPFLVQGLNPTAFTGMQVETYSSSYHLDLSADASSANQGRVNYNGGGAAAAKLSLQANGITSAEVDGDTTAGNTRFLLWDVTKAALSRVSVGTNDSAGAGYKILKVPN